MRLSMQFLSVLSSFLIFSLDRASPDEVPEPSGGLLPPLINAPDVFQRIRRTVKVPSFSLEAPAPQEHEQILKLNGPTTDFGSVSNPDQIPNNDPVTYLTPPAKESKYAEYIKLGVQILKQFLVPPTREQPEIFRNISDSEDNKSLTKAVDLTQISKAKSQNLNSTSEKSEVLHKEISNNTLIQEIANEDYHQHIHQVHADNGALLGGGISEGNKTEAISEDDGSGRSKRFVIPIAIDTSGGCCDTCGRCDDDLRDRRWYRRGRYGRRPRRRFGRRFPVPLYDDYDYGDACNDCGRK